MDKVLDLLEKHCQWIAVGLGGLFLAWMLWSYVLLAPVAATAGNAQLTPGDVDDHVQKNYADPLDAEMKREGVERRPGGSANDVTAEWMSVIKNGSDQPVASLAPSWIYSQPSEMKLGPTGNEVVPVAQLVMALPKLPASDMLEAFSKRAYVGEAPPAPLAAGQVAPPVPVPPVLAPGQLPPGRDLTYVRLSYRFPTDEISKSFIDANVPTGAGSTTAVVALKLMRQEQQSDGTWASPTEVPTIKNNVPIWPLPKAPEEANAFRGWAESPQGQNDLLRPYFYPTILGEGPWDPPMDDALPKVDPAAELLERARIAKERELQRRQAPPPPTPRGPRAPRRGAGGGLGEGAAADPNRPAMLSDLIGQQLAQARPPAGAPPGTSGDMTPFEGMTGNLPTQPGVPLIPGQVPPPADPLPTTNFQPGTTAPFLAWAYDETVVEGHTYRYQMLYALRSPVYESNITKPPELAQIFAAWSEVHEEGWGQPVEVKPTTEYYLAATNWPADRIPSNIKIEVFKWAQGKWQTLPFTVAPGDKVGDVQGGVDYGTNVTVVDLKYDSRGNGGQGAGRPFVLLLTADGRLVEREPTADRNNPRFNALKKFVQQVQQQAPAVPGVAPAGRPPLPGQPPFIPGQLPGDGMPG